MRRLLSIGFVITILASIALEPTCYKCLVAVNGRFVVINWSSLHGQGWHRKKGLYGSRYRSAQV